MSEKSNMEPENNSSTKEKCEQDKHDEQDKHHEQDKQDEQDEKNIKTYLNQLSDNEKKSYEIAKQHLESSFSIAKSIGFINWNENK